MSVNISLHPVSETWKVVDVRSYGHDITLHLDGNSISIFSGHDRTHRLVTAIRLRDQLINLIDNEVTKDVKSWLVGGGHESKTS